MRHYTEYISGSTEKELLNVLLDEHISVDGYRNAMRQLGVLLGEVICNKYALPIKNDVITACAVEDADWLTLGLIKSADLDSQNIAVFWNDRVSVKAENGSKVEISPIIKSYFDKTKRCVFA